MAETAPRAPDVRFLACAEAAHEAVRIFCEAHGQRILKHWGKTSRVAKARALAAIPEILADKKPRQYRATTDLDQLCVMIHREVAIAVASGFGAEAAAKGPTIEVVSKLPAGLSQGDGRKAT